MRLNEPKMRTKLKAKFRVRGHIKQQFQPPKYNYTRYVNFGTFAIEKSSVYADFHT